MTDIVKGMARVIVESMGDTPENAARAALMFLADNVSDEMVKAYIYCPEPMGRNVKENVRKSLVSAIRAAAGEEGK
jgi:hypothetical protein